MYSSSCSIVKYSGSFVLGYCKVGLYLENVLQHPPDYELVLHIRTITSLMDGYPIAMPTIEYDLIEKWIKEYETEHNVSFTLGANTWIGHG